NGEWNYSIPACIAEFQEAYPGVAANHNYNNLRKTIQYTISLFDETGSIDHRPRSGRPTVRNEENINNIQAVVENNPSKSIRKLSQQMELSYGTCQRILKQDIGLRAYKIQASHKIFPVDFEPRRNSCEWFNANLRDNDDLLD
ncbi:HTH 29 domain containing protein, partial [Asbolus verrucosus]